MNRWLDRLKYDPLPILLSARNQAIDYFARRDLRAEKVGPVNDLWATPAAQRILNRQQPDGFWRYPGGRPDIRERENYNQLETYRVLGFLVEKHGMDKRHPAIPRAAEFLFSFQTREGDFRGIYGNQYTPNYSAGIMELLIKAGYEDDARIERGFRWLLSIRQDDGGWAIPLRTRRLKLDAIAMENETVQPDRAKPFSHLVTGCVLRAFAVHPHYCRAPEARRAGELLAARIFKPDAYPDRGTVEYWTGFRFPFWFNDLLSALDTLSRMGFPADEPGMRKGLGWFARKQRKDGRWRLRMLVGTGDPDLDLWMTLQISRVFRRFYR